MAPRLPASAAADAANGMVARSSRLVMVEQLIIHWEAQGGDWKAQCDAGRIGEVSRAGCLDLRPSGQRIPKLLYLGFQPIPIRLAQAINQREQLYGFSDSLLNLQAALC
jgi:hypothetical protein